jgi:hypothetical protein
MIAIEPHEVAMAIIVFSQLKHKEMAGMPLTQKQIKDVCLVNQGYRQCRFLAPDTTWGHYNCLKKTSQKKVIDEEVQDVLVSLKQQGRDYRKSQLPIGDNCQGYPLLKTIDQGYDV